LLTIKQSSWSFSFAAALAVRTPPVPWWVLNVVPVDQPDRLPIIFDRGLLGIYHDWYVLITHFVSEVRIETHELKSVFSFSIYQKQLTHFVNK